MLQAEATAKKLNRFRPAAKHSQRWLPAVANDSYLKFFAPGQVSYYLGVCSGKITSVPHGRPELKKHKATQNK
jgi:hypothetical protein